MSEQHQRETDADDAIAIIGMACTFPGAADLEGYWRNILNKVCAIGEPPAEWGAERYYDPEADGGDRVYTKAGGFLGDLARFDPREFGIMPNSIDGGEPDQFLALKAASDALRDAGYRDGHDHTATGIILGHSTYLHRGNASVVQHGIVLDQTVELLAQLHPELTDEELQTLRRQLKEKLPPFNVDIAPGLVPNVMTGRIANRLDLKGPNYLIDAACASSLLAVGAAMEELRTGRADLMLAGGVNASIPAEVDMVFCQLGALARDSQIRPFDRGANGTLLGEGLGVVALKRLADARRDGDRVYAVLRAVGNSSDGKALGLLAPRLEGEVLAIERAYAQCGVDPASVRLVEAHGTGIPLGDQTEVTALRTVLGERDAGLPACALGSVKSMISHCIPAAGAASLIKTALALHHKVYPPTLCDEVNPELGIERTKLYINNEVRPWVNDGAVPRRAAVNAFGFGGINTHAVLEEAPPELAAPRRWAPRPAELVLLAGDSRQALLEEAERLAAFCERSDGVALFDLAATLAEAPGVGDQRLAVVADDTGDLALKLRQAAERLADPQRHRLQSRSGIYFSDAPAEGKLGFMFPGEGSQYQGMLGDLALHFPSVRRWLDFWDGLYRDSREVLPSHILFPPPTGLSEAEREELQQRLYGMDVGSESVFIASQALFELLGELGVEPEAMVGHSTGENSALVAAGIARFADREALGRHIVELNRVYKALEEAGEIPTGRLLTVGAVPREQVLERVEASGGELHLAMDNCGHQAVLFGAPAAIDAAARELGEVGGLCSVLPFDRAYHTPLFQGVADAFERFYGGVRVQAPAVPLYSCANAAPFPKSAAAIRRRAASQWASRVRFTETVERMYADGVRTFLEVGPGGNLSSFVKDILGRRRAHTALQSNNRNRTGLEQLQHVAAQLFVQGRPLRPAALFAGQAHRAIDWQGEPVAATRPPALRYTLPYVRLDAAQVAAWRERLQPPAGEPVAPTAAAPAEGTAPTGTRERVVGGHLELMQHFLDNQRQVMTQGIAGRRRQQAAPRPFVARLLERSADAVTARCDLSLAAHRFLQDHVLSGTVSARDRSLHGLAVVPLTVSLEMLAEAAAVLARQPALVALENIRAYNWVALDAERITLTLHARSLPTAGGDERFAAQVRQGEQVMLEGEVVFAADYPAAPPPREPLPAPRPSRWRPEELYTTGMFHGPLFQSVARIDGWNEGGIDAALAPLDTRGFFRGRAAPGFVFNPILLDAIGQLTAYWVSEQVGTDFNSFPSSIERVRFYRPQPGRADGLSVRGRLAFLPAQPGEKQFLEGAFDCLDARGQVWFRAEGWRDRYFTVPHRFYLTRSNPARGELGEEWTSLFAGFDGSAVFVPAFEPGFLEDAGGIWKRVLAHQYLSRSERAQWEALPPNPRRRSDWLLGRIAAKEAVRRWLHRHHGLWPYPADIVTDSDARGRPFVAPEALAGLAVPYISIAHSGGAALAAADNVALGVDFEPAGRTRLDEFLRGGFDSAEQQTLSGAEEAQVLARWCAKEAAAKALGEGLNGRPTAFTTQADGATGVTVTFQGRRVDAVTVQHGAVTAALARLG